MPFQFLGVVHKISHDSSAVETFLAGRRFFIADLA